MPGLQEMSAKVMRWIFDYHLTLKMGSGKENRKVSKPLRKTVSEIYLEFWPFDIWPLKKFHLKQKSEFN